MSDKPFLIASRGHSRTQVTKLHQKLKSTTFPVSRIELGAHRIKVTKLQSELHSLDSRISSLTFNESGDDQAFISELEACDSYNDKLIECLAILDSAFSALNATTDRDISRDQPNRDQPNIEPAAIKPTKLKLPELPLPSYSNAKNETLAAFLTSFESVISTYRLSSYEKFVFLKKQLRNEPLVLIQSLELANQSYESAVDLLSRAFASDISQKFKVLERLSQLKCSSSKPFEFISEMRLVRDLITTLKIDVNTILQYFVWNGLTTDLQTQLVSICNTNKPSITDIEENIFRAVDRLKELNVRTKTNESKPETDTPQLNYNNFAASVSAQSTKRSQIFCSLCSEKGHSNSHSTRNCPAYESPRAKRDRLIVINGCTLCGYSNHTTGKCKFKFPKKCLHCNEPHMTYLCINSEASPESSKQQIPATPRPSRKTAFQTKTVTSGVAWTGAVLQTSVGQEAILPTFSCRVGKISVRALKDSGSQTTFIQTSLATELNLPVINDNLKLTVQGFNEAREYLTKEVQVTLHFKNSIQLIHAVCVPKINTSLKIHGLGEIVKNFQTKNYVLADENLSQNSDEISNIRLILGTNDAHILCETHVQFGQNTPSIYSQTDEGILLMGNSERIINNLPFLACKTTEITKPKTNKSDHSKLIEPIIWKSNVFSSFVHDSHLARKIPKSNEISCDAVKMITHDPQLTRIAEPTSVPQSATSELHSAAAMHADKDQF